jgi:hypothetical protein
MIANQDILAVGGLWLPRLWKPSKMLLVGHGHRTGWFWSLKDANGGKISFRKKGDSLRP